ncbi:MAG: hypothetical protein BGO01_08695 [Armatimonadetes bacterium 55-13]|nr:hypothetical protein [Armatimonadota bacterium]OJU61940.1 MAG: hypothetical protein BGO01_08695 [Armatimonadetes bacterium 55-13]
MRIEKLIPEEDVEKLEEKTERDTHPPDRLEPEDKQELYPDEEIRSHPDKGEKMAHSDKPE